MRRTGRWRRSPWWARTPVDGGDRGESGNIRPTTACIAALAVFQLGLALLARPALERWARRRRWRAVVAANGLAMPVFVWHMTALVTFIVALRAVRVHAGRESDGSGWLSRPLWLAGPALVLAAVLASPAACGAGPLTCARCRVVLASWCWSARSCWGPGSRAFSS